MTAEAMERLREKLWPLGVQEGAYAILDGARDPAVFPLVQGLGPSAECLYVGRLSPSLARAAPYLVQLERGTPATERVLAQGWGKSWGVFLRCRSPMRAAHRHLRRLLRVQDEAGKRLLFRYYDPRVLRAYLPTCTAEELAFVFGPIEAFVVEGETPEHILEFVLQGGALTRHEARVERRLEWLKDYLKRT